LLVFFGLTNSNYSHWIKAFEVEEDDHGSEDLVKKIIEDFNKVY